MEITSELPLGAHVVTPRCWYTHHAIYVGHGRVVQYGGLARRLESSRFPTTLDTNV